MCPPKCRQAIRRPSSNSTTSLRILYGAPMRMFMPNRAPGDSRSGVPRWAPLTVPEPSINACWAGLASSSKMSSADAGTIRVASAISMVLGSAVMGPSVSNHPRTPQSPRFR